MARILAALSGGVDSSVAAAILVRDGHEVIGVSLQLSDHSGGGTVSRCCSASDLRDARKVSAFLKIPYYVLNEELTFKQVVLEPFMKEYGAGRTPNPCVACNSHLKFGSLVRMAKALGLEKVATGHYARLEQDEAGRAPRLLRALDQGKDQSYFLYDLDEEQRRRSLFPLGGMAKPDVKALAGEMGLPVAGKGESQDLCFIPDGDLRAFLRREIREDRSGDMVDREGRILGRHAGVHQFTIGQRRGLGLAGRKPLYVISLDGPARRVVVGSREELFCRGLEVAGVRMHDRSLEGSPFRAEAKVRSRHVPAPCQVRIVKPGRARILFDDAQEAVTPGQAVVLYREELVLGGGVIESVELDPACDSSLHCGKELAARA